jgi:DNA-3-methyladenine glycosylase II
MPLSKSEFETALGRLRRADRVMRTLIDEVGPFTLKPQPDRFGMLVRSIISQQISTGAAISIRKRLEQLSEPEGLTAPRLGRFTAEELRSAGVSPQKARYLLDLARHVNEGKLELGRIGRLDDEQIIQRLTAVKGIGRWTAQMFLIFSLVRPDVFPHDDLGVRTVLRDRYALDELPDKETSLAIAARWRPYATVASWYCWRSLDVKRNTAAAKKRAADVQPKSAARREVRVRRETSETDP